MTKLDPTTRPLYRSLRLRLLAGVAGAALIAGTTQAQTAPPQAPAPAPAASTQTDSQVEQIVVTASLRRERVQDVPYDMSAVTGDSIAAREITDDNELLRTIPGVSVVDRGYQTGSLNGARIRGLNVDGAALGDYALASVSPLSTYVNDTPVFANFLLKDIDRVEVLRGPQGTLYGSGSLGGTVRYIENEPDPSAFSGTISTLAYHTENSDGAGWNGDLTLNIPILDTVAFRATISRIDDPGSIDDPNLYKLNAQGFPDELNGRAAPDASDFYRADSVDTAHIWYGRASLLWQPNSDFKLVANYNTQSDHTGGPREITEGDNGFGQPYGPYEDGAVIPQKASRSVSLESLEGTYDLGFATLTESTSYYDHRGQSVTDNTGFYGHAIAGFPPGFLYYFSYYAPNRLPLTVFDNSYSDRAIVEETRLVSTPGKILDYSVGVFYEDQARGALSQNFLPGFQETYLENPVNGPGFVSGDRSFLYHRGEAYDEKAVFGEVTYHVTDRFDVTGGMRYFDDNDSVHSLIGGGVLTVNNIYTQSQSSTSESKALGKGNASWKIDANDLLFATVSQGYRRGGSNAIPITGPTREDASFLNFKSDSVVNYETGIKGTFQGIAYSAAAYYIDWTNVQVNIQTPTWAYFAVANGPSAVSKGLELELDGFALPGWHYNLGYAYNQANLTANIVTAGNIHDPGSSAISGFSGARLPGVADDTVNLGTDYTFTVANGVDLVTRLSGYYQSSSRNSVTPGALAVGIDPFWLWTASAGIEVGSWDVTLFVKNLFNANAITGLYTEAYSGTDPAGGFYGNDNRAIISQPRTVGMAFNYRF